MLKSGLNQIVEDNFHFQDTGSVLWKVQLAAPIFANLCIVELNRVLVVNVKGLITLCDTRTGHIVCVFFKYISLSFSIYMGVQIGTMTKVSYITLPL